jgi:DNA modification methylase
VVWAKPNPMPDPAHDRPARSHEYVFLLSKSRRYYYDAGAIAEPAVSDHPSRNRFRRHRRLLHGNRGNSTFWKDVGGRRQCRDVWQLSSEPTNEAHYATFPAELARRCVLAGSRPGDLACDPFLGSGTTAEVAERLGRQWVGIERSAEYSALVRRRSTQVGLPLKYLSDSKRPPLAPVR